MESFVEQIPPEFDTEHLKRKCERVQEIYLPQRQRVNPDELALSTELTQSNRNIHSRCTIATVPFGQVTHVNYGSCSAQKVQVENSC